MKDTCPNCEDINVRKKTGSIGILCFCDHCGFFCSPDYWDSLIRNEDVEDRIRDAVEKAIEDTMYRIREKK